MEVHTRNAASENGQNDFTSSGNSIVDEIDSYMEDLNDRLTVSRMVTESVIKGMVNAIEEECAEKISLNEAGLSNLSNKLFNHDAILGDKFLIDQLCNTHEKCNTNVISVGKNIEFSGLALLSSTASHIDYVNRLRSKTEEWIEELRRVHGKAKRNELSQADALSVEVEHSRYCSQTESNHQIHIVDVDSFETLLTEMSTYLRAVIPMVGQESKYVTPVDITTTLLQNFASLRHEYETTILNQKAHMNDLMQKWQNNSNELATLRVELDDMYKTLVSWETGSIFPHSNHEISEERNALKKKDQVQWKPAVNSITSHVEISNPVTKKDMDFEKHINADSPQLMSMSKEELISHFKFEMGKMSRQHDAALQVETEKFFCLKREILKNKGSSHLNFKKDKEVEFMRKRISEIVSKLDDILLINESMCFIDDEEYLCSFTEKINAILIENQHLVALLDAKKKEAAADSFKTLDTEYQLPNSFVGQIEKLQLEIEALKFEMSIKDAMNMSTLQELHVEIAHQVEEMEMETKIEQCICFFIFVEVVRDAISILNSFMADIFDQKKYLSNNLLDKEKALSVEVEENKMLKKQIESFSTLLKTTKMHALDLESLSMHLREQFDSVCHERDALQGQLSKQELLLAESTAEIDKIDQNLKTVSLALQDTEKQKNILQSELMDIQANFALKNAEVKSQRKLVESILTSMSELEYKVNSTIELNESRLKVLTYQSNKLSEQARLAMKKVPWYREALERRCDDLKKAETEVDLLGDEVDNLISLLRRIYFTLEHYSLVLQYYPGELRASAAENKPICILRIFSWKFGCNPNFLRKEWDSFMLPRKI